MNGLDLFKNITNTYKNIAMKYVKELTEAQIKFQLECLKTSGKFMEGVGFNECKQLFEATEDGMLHNKMELDAIIDAMTEYLTLDNN